MTESSSSESEEEGERGGPSIYTAAYFLKKWVWLIADGTVTYIATVRFHFYVHVHRDKGKDEVTKVRKPRERKTKAEEEEEEAEEEGEWQTVQRKSHDQLSHKVSSDVPSWHRPTSLLVVQKAEEIFVRKSLGEKLQSPGHS